MKRRRVPGHGAEEGEGRPRFGGEGRKKAAYGTWGSQGVTHPSTSQARDGLPSEIGRDRGRSVRYGRRPRAPRPPRPLALSEARGTEPRPAPCSWRTDGASRGISFPVPRAGGSGLLEGRGFLSAARRANGECVCWGGGGGGRPPVGPILPRRWIGGSQQVNRRGFSGGPGGRWARGPAGQPLVESYGLTCWPSGSRKCVRG